MAIKEEKYDAICYILDRVFHSDEWEAARGYTLVEKIINNELGVSKKELDAAIGKPDQYTLAAYYDEQKNKNV